MIINKQRIVYIIRRVHLLQLLDKLIFIGNALKNRRSNRRFLIKQPNFIAPPAYLAFDAYNHTNWKNYYHMGGKHSKLISNLIKKYLFEKEIKICEWGCGPARVIRHLKKITGFEKIELIGTDYNKNSIKWCNKNIRDIEIITNSLNPPLKLESETFDCVYAISIFTHLSEKLHYAWIKELFRIIKPNGILIFTTHGDLCAKRLLPSEKKIYNLGSLVIKGQTKEGKKHYAAYHPPAFIKNKLLKDYVIIKHIKNPTDYELDQDVWVAAKIKS